MVRTSTESQMAGYAKGTIYNYFESKHTLMQALIADTVTLHFECITERIMKERKLERWFPDL